MPRAPGGQNAAAGERTERCGRWAGSAPRAPGGRWQRGRRAL